MAKIFDKSGEKCTILAVREALVQRFEVPDWIDLRIGWFLSVTQAAADDVITGLAETISVIGDPWNYWYAGGASLDGTTFMGYSNIYFTGPPKPSGTSLGTSQLVSSDAGLGTSNTNFWRPKNGIDDIHTAEIHVNGPSSGFLAQGIAGSQPHFAQNAGGAGGYATLLLIRFTRPSATGNDAKYITMSIKKAASGDSGDVLFSNTPTAAILQTNLQTFPANVQTLGPVSVPNPPARFFLYWPFRNSRLRIHSAGIFNAS